ncbi:transglycosylase SLT domain-containing protein [Noviherbaspirillum sp. CPCC 100848]|uniref:Transglycosylase SLT domain-containing protein n=1 Tax=Noviherbaspirillum album TaxID=3080276 RepID=A0ABU6JBV1_9BURK|nr:transglycosylase SLT domain-containing protein [Noviherbaspirillum sp. CPCC 100848]MEC4721133.1 transglycosylase SLT domain-containing protein [Noviherbaspirillum sp. CPCC 100848]
MINRYTQAAYDFTRQQATQSAAWAVFARDTFNGFMITARHTLTLLGIAALALLGIMVVKPEAADRLKTLSPFVAATTVPSSSPLAAASTVAELPRTQPATATAIPPAAATSLIAVSAMHTPTAANGDAAHAGNAKQQQWVTEWLSKRYRVAADATNMLVSAAYLTAKEIKLDPLLILSVMAIESGFNPFAESPVGAQGLMQVMSKVHHDKFRELGGVKAALNPVANIRVGSLILKDYVERGGSVEAGLKMYVGAGALETDFGYGAKVLAEYRRLKEVAMGKKVPVITSTAKASSPSPAQVKPAPAEVKTPPPTEEATTAMNETRPLVQNEESQLAPAL